MGAYRSYGFTAPGETSRTFDLLVKEPVFHHAAQFPIRLQSDYAMSFKFGIIRHCLDHRKIYYNLGSKKTVAH